MESDQNHVIYLKSLCRTCGASVVCDKRQGVVQEFKSECEELWGIDVNQDLVAVHPPGICVKCKKTLSRKRKANSEEKGFTSKKAVVDWKPHKSKGCECLSNQHTEGSDTDTGDEGEEIEIREFENILTEAKLLTKQHSFQLAWKLGQLNNFIVLDKQNLRNSLESLENDLQQEIVSEIVSLQRDCLKKQATEETGSLTLEDLSKTEKVSWLEQQPRLITEIVNSLSDEATPSLAKIAAAEHLNQLTSRRHISPWSFACTVVCYSITRSRTMVELLGKMHPSGSYSYLKSWLDSLSLKPLKFPNGDCWVAFDNDQIVQKRWTVRVENKAKVSILTSVCQAEVDPLGTLQRAENLSPRVWASKIDIAQNDTEEGKKLVDECLTSEFSSIIRKENKELIQKCLKEIVLEHRKEDGMWNDEIDQRVKDLEAKEGKRTCPVCSTVMDKRKRKCVNGECKVDLKQAEERMNGVDVLGTALVAPVRKYNHNFKETTVGFTVSEGNMEMTQTAVVSHPVHERDDIPSGHPDHPIPITVSDPVFVNPSSFSAVRDVLRHIGKSAGIKRYGTGDREWLAVTMDGLPYSLAQQIVENTVICVECQKEHPERDNSMWLKNWNQHVMNCHGGARTKYIKEFDWVVLRIGKLHVEMNMGKYVMEFTWDVFMSELAAELGFTSEPAQKYAKKGGNTHHTMTLLQVAHKGTWMELLVPYVKERLHDGKPISVNDYLYTWLLGAIHNPNYVFMFSFAWKYLGGFFAHHHGVRRNNNEYVCAGMEAFASLFHFKPSSKYATIELRDRLARVAYPKQLADFLSKNESISSSGNKSKGQDMDAQLEEINKQSKVWHRGATVAADWLRIFRNLDHLTKLRTWMFDVSDMKDPKEDNEQGRRKYSLEAEVLALRAKLRKEKYLLYPKKKEEHKSISGNPLDSGLIGFVATLHSNRKTTLMLNV